MKIEHPIVLTNRFTLAKNAAVLLLFVMSAPLFTVPSAQAENAEVESSGILPLLDYSGDFDQRSYLLGDLGGKRTEWAKQGVSFNIDYNQYFQGVTDGGVERDSEYGGTIDYNINLDFDRMGLIPGGLVTLRAVSRYGNTINDISGSIIPVNTDAAHPVTLNPDEDVALWLPVINYTQFLGETFALGFGKYDTYDSSNEFAGGRGRSQWWNLNLALPVSPALIIPYSVLGATALFMPSPNLSITGMVATSTDTSNRSGFDDLDNGLFAMLSISYQYQLGGLPGGFSFMPGYGWNGQFNKINGGINIENGQLIPTTKDDAWFVSTDFWQYLWTKEAAKQPINLSDGRQDLQGVGVFLRFQGADQDTNLLEYSVAGGISAKGLIPGRNNDAMGIAHIYNKLQKGRFLNAIGVGTQSSVWELFYNIELTPAVHATLDAQIVNSAAPNIDTATILGASMQIRF